MYAHTCSKKFFAAPILLYLQILCNPKAQSRFILASLSRAMTVCHVQCVESFFIPLLKSPNLGECCSLVVFSVAHKTHVLVFYNVFVCISPLCEAVSHVALLKQVVRQNLTSSDQEALLQEVLDMTSEGMHGCFNTCIFWSKGDIGCNILQFSPWIQKEQLPLSNCSDGTRLSVFPIEMHRNKIFGRLPNATELC